MKPQKPGERSNQKWIFLFLLPTLIFYFLFVLWPVVASVYYSFFEWNGLTTFPTYFVGLRNYIDTVTDYYFWNSFKNITLFVIIQNVVKLSLTLVIAYFLNNVIKRGSVLFRTIIFLPVISSTAILGIIMKFMLHPWQGPINTLLKQLYLIDRPIDFLGSTSTALITVSLVGVWQIAGQYVIYWMAGLQAIPSELYEAAEIDGAGGFAKFFYITLPLLKPIAIVITLIGIAMSLRTFDLVLVMTGGGPSFSTEIITTYIYDKAFSSATMQLGIASTAAVIFGIVIMAFGVFQGILVRKYKKEMGPI